MQNMNQIANRGPADKHQHAQHNKIINQKAMAANNSNGSHSEPKYGKHHEEAKYQSAKAGKEVGESNIKGAAGNATHQSNKSALTFEESSHSVANEHSRGEESSASNMFGSP